MAEGDEARRQLFAERRRLWQAGRARVVMVRELEAGRRVRMQGRAVPLDAPLRAALTGSPAIFWEASVMKRRLSLLPAGHRGPSSTPWGVLFVDAAVTPFTLVDDAGGRVHVLVDGARSVLASVSPDAVSDHPRVNRDDPELAAYLARHGIASARQMGTTGAFHFLEAVVGPDDRVGIYGSVRLVPVVEELGYREGQAEALAIVATPEDPLVLTRA